MLNPCTREPKARTGRFLREKLISDHGLFSSYEDRQGARTGKVRGALGGMHMALDDGMLVRTPASPDQGLHYDGPRYFIFSRGLVKLGLVHQN